MLKPILLVFACCFLLSVTLYSQNDSIAAKTQKNEISIKIQPALYYMLGGTDYAAAIFAIDNRNTLGILYKHFFNKSGLRAGINFNFNDFIYYYNGTFGVYSGPEGLKNIQFNFPVSCNTYSSVYPGFFDISFGYYLRSNYIAGTSLGYEYVMGKRKLKHFIGIDINNSLYRLSEVTEKYYWKIDTMSNGSYYNDVDSIAYLGPHKSSLIKLGFAPFYGIKYSFSNRLSMSLQTGIEYYFIKGRIKFVDENGNKYFQSINQSGSYSQSFITDISLIYRF